MTQPAVNPNDAYFKLAFGDPASAELLLRSHLPAAWAAALVPGSVRRMDAAFVAGDLRQHLADKLYEVSIRMDDGSIQSALAFMLFEHKSAPDRFTPLQLLRYKVSIWEQWAREHRDRPLPLVLGVVVFQGPEPWPGEPRLSSLFAPVPPRFAGALPDFEFVLVDLGRLDDDALADHPRTQAMLMVLKYLRRRDLAVHLVKLLRTVLHLQRLEIEATFRYLDSSPARLAPDAVVAALKAIAVTDGANTMGIIEHIQAEGEARGLALGEARGEARGKSRGKGDALVLLLAQRFGPLPDAVISRVERASDTDLDTCLSLVLTAPSLDQVFAR